VCVCVCVYIYSYKGLALGSQAHASMAVIETWMSILQVSISSVCERH